MTLFAVIALAMAALALAWVLPILLRSRGVDTSAPPAGSAPIIHHPNK